MLIACYFGDLFDHNGVGGHICNENGGFGGQLEQVIGYSATCPRQNNSDTYLC